MILVVPILQVFLDLLEPWHGVFINTPYRALYLPEK